MEMMKENKGVTWKRNRKRRKQDKNNEGRGRREKGVWLERRKKRTVDKRK